jgi:hypothetical protein
MSARIATKKEKVKKTAKKETAKIAELLGKQILKSQENIAKTLDEMSAMCKKAEKEFK